MAAPIRVEANGPWDHRAALNSLLIHAVDGLERAETGRARHVRRIEVGDESLPIAVTLDPGGLELESPTSDRGLNELLTSRVRFWFDLDAETDRIDRFFADDPVLGPWVAARPGVRVTRFVDGFEAAATTVMGQQVTLAAARGYGGRLVAAYGAGHEDGSRSFPRAERVAAEPVDTLREVLRTTNARARTLRSVARLFADGFDLGPGVDPPEARETLLAVNGIGPWTAGYLSIRALSDPDAFPASDAVLRRALDGIGAREADEVAARWRPLRTYAAMRLWNAPSGIRTQDSQVKSLQL